VASATTYRTSDPAGSASALPAGPRPVRSSSTRQRRAWRKRIEIAAFVGPALIVFLIFVIVPMVLAIHRSMYKWNGLLPMTEFIGFDNYTRALGNEVFQKALTHNLFYVVGSLVVQLPIAIGVALLLNRPMRGRPLFRLLIFAPYVVSEAVAAVLWRLILQPNAAVDKWFEAAGLGEFKQLWLADQDFVLWTMLFLLTWKYVGFAIILMLAGLQNVPKELEEAAAIDGAGWWQTQWRVTLPLLGPTIRVWIFLSMIGALQLFDMIWIVAQRGGPANASATMATYMINDAFYRQQFGYAHAVSVIMFSICFVVAILYQRLVLRRDLEGALTRGVN
jgi:raffinose/stachyose/melibiose transport system permease protein